MMTNPVILLALLCCAVRSAAAGDVEFRCMYGEIAKNSGAMPARIVESGLDSGKVKGATIGDSTAEWETMRYKVFSEDLNDAKRYCTAEGQSRPTFTAPSDVAKCKKVDVLTAEKKSTLIYDMIPAALKLHSDRLLVQRITGKIIVPAYTKGYCGSMTVPKSHKSEGVADTDMIMYVASGPASALIMWAGACSFAENMRSVVGFMNVGAIIIGTTQKNIRIAAHEIGHALGFDFGVMRSLHMLNTVPNIRGQNRVLVTSGRTRREAGAHYNCHGVPGMELENEGGDATSLSHFERRNAKDELMAGIVDGGYYTALSMAVFDDMGFFKANWGMEETMEWGRNKSCAFLKEPCIKDGNLNYPDMFCVYSDSRSICTFDRKGLGKCGLGKHAAPLPAEFQYFKDKTIGGTSELLDFCPIVVQYDNAGCKDGNTKVMPGSRIGLNSRCVKGIGLRLKDQAAVAVQDVCAEISCKDNSVSVRYLGNNKWHKCPEGTKIAAKGSFAAGEIVCPRYSEVCVGLDGVGPVSFYLLHFVLIWITFLIL